MKKIFCIGFNKTGTTSLKDLFSNNGFESAPQRVFESKLNSYESFNPSTFINMIKEDYSHCTFFQDVPFSLPNFYKTLYQEFPDSYFILSTRNTPEIWYNSILSYHQSIFHQQFIKSPWENTYIYEGWVYNYLCQLHYSQPNIKVLGSPKSDPYNKTILIESYNNHNNGVKEFFKDKDNLIEINLSIPKDFDKLQNFLNVKFKDTSFPHSNKSK